jgi:hypothetical protein
MRRRFAVCRGLTLAGALSLAAVADKPQRSDPARREEARRVVQGDRTPEAAAEILRIARAEAVRWGLDRSTTLEMPAAVAGNAWINLGPTSADKDFNGSVYFKVDSGRARKILVDPRNSDVVYFATAGGGVWKTFDAVSTPVTSTTGPHWVPITETVGSLSIGSIALSPANPDSLILGLGDSFDVKVPGVLHSDDGGATWQGLVTLTATYLGYQPITATSVRDIQYNPTMSSTVLMATNAGLFRSTEGGVGTNWVLKDTDVAHTPQGCWSIGWVGGQTWLATCQNLTDAHGRIWRSTDDGVSWSEVLLPGTDSTDVKRMTVATSPSDVANPSSVRVYLLAAAYSASKQKDIYISSTGGTTWTSLGCYAGSIKTPAHAADYAGDQSDLDVIHDQSNYNQMLIVDPRNHDTVLAGGNLGMIRSTDAGATWDVFAWWLPTNAYPRVPAAEYVHADWHTATIAYSGPTPYFYAGTDGGIFRSTNVLSAAYGAEVWEDRLNRGLVTHMLYSVATASEGRASASCTMPASALDIVWGGMQDNGTRFRVLPGSGGSNDPTHFDQLDGGDGFGVGVGCSGPATQTGSLLLSTVPTRVDRILNGGPPAKAMTGITITPDPNFNFFMRLATDHGDTNGQTFIVPIDDASVASKNGYIFKTTNGAASWTNITGTINRADGTPATATPLPLVNITADPKNPNHYGVVSVTRAFVSSDGGVNWYETNRVYPGANTAGPCVQPSNIALDPSDTTSNTVWVTSAATTTSGRCSATTVPIDVAVGHLFLTRNAKAGLTQSWIAVTGLGAGALPNVPANVVKVDPGDSNTIYVGTEIGLYKGSSSDGGTTWSFVRYGSGLPLVNVTDLAISLDGSAIRVATFGRGFWEIYPKSGGSLTGVYGTGDFDYSQTIDGYDLVREAAVLLTDSSSPDYNAIGHLVGTTNSIGSADMSALIAKFGGRP